MDKIFTKSLSLSLFTMPAFILTIRHGGNIAAITILLLSLVVLVSRPSVNLILNKKEKVFIFSLLLLPIIIAFDVILRDLKFKYLDYYLRFILVIPIYFALKGAKVELKPVFIGILTGAIGTGLFSLYLKFYLNEMNATGYIFKISFGNISLLLGMMSLSGLFLIQDTRFKKTIYSVTGIAFTLGVIASVLSGARGGWMAIPFFVGLFLMYFPVKKTYKIVSVFILVVVMVITYYSSAHVKSRIDSTYINTKTYFSSDSLAVVQNSTSTRLEMWKAGWKIFTEHPLFGIGSGQFRSVIKAKMESGEIEAIPFHNHVHNEPLQILIITGIVGLIGYMTLYVGTAYFFYNSLVTSNSNRVQYLSFLGVMIVGGYFIFGLTNYSFGHQAMVLFFAVMVASLAGVISAFERA